MHTKDSDNWMATTEVVYYAVLFPLFLLISFSALLTVFLLLFHSFFLSTSSHTGMLQVLRFIAEMKMGNFKENLPLLLTHTVPL